MFSMKRRAIENKIARVEREQAKRKKKKSRDRWKVKVEDSCWHCDLYVLFLQVFGSADLSLRTHLYNNHNVCRRDGGTGFVKPLFA